MKDCRDCKHAAPGYHQWLCNRITPPKETSWRRDPRNECGLAAKLFEPKEQKR